MEKRKSKLGSLKLKSILVILIIAIAGGYRFYTQNFLENRAVLNYSSKQKIKPANSGNIQANQLSKLDFNDQVIVEVNNGKPTFSDQELKAGKSWESYSPFDDLKRAGQANALLGQDLMPTESRERLNYEPTGWRSYQVNYKNQTGSLYNRSHLIGFQLAGENNTPQNLVTGTWQMNAYGMEFYETEIKYYLKQTNHQVRYQVTPIYREQELVPRGVHMMARSIEDNAISFNVYIFNVQPDISINYKTGLASGSALIYHDNDGN